MAPACTVEPERRSARSKSNFGVLPAPWLWNGPLKRRSSGPVRPPTPVVRVVSSTSSRPLLTGLFEPKVSPSSLVTSGLGFDELPPHAERARHRRPAMIAVRFTVGQGTVRGPHDAAHDSLHGQGRRRQDLR